MAAVTVQHAKNVTVADWSGTVTVANSTGGTTTAAASDLARPSDWNSAHNVTINLSASDITPILTVGGELSLSTSSNGLTVYKPIVYDEFYEPFVLPNTNSTISAPGIGSWYLDPFSMHADISGGLIFMPVVGGASTNFCQDGAVWSAASTGSNTRYQTHINAVALYKRGSGNSTSRFESMWSSSADFRLTWERRWTSGATNAGTMSQYLTISAPLNFNTSGGVTYTTNAVSGTVGVAASTGASTLGSSLLTGAARYFTGSRMEIVPINTSLPEGDYLFAHMFSSSTSVTGTNYTGGTVFTTQSRLGMLENNMGAFKQIGQSTTNATSSPQIFHGYFATTSLSAPAVINSSDVRSTTGRAYWNYALTTY